MTVWNFDVAKAPKGHHKEVEGPKGPRQVHVPEKVFLACRDGETVTLSHWIEKEQRWAMLANGEEPIAWAPWPKHPQPKDQDVFS